MPLTTVQQFIPFHDCRQTLTAELLHLYMFGYRREHVMRRISTVGSWPVCDETFPAA
jgi:hypothetical protein